MLLLILRDLQYRRWRVALTVVLMSIVLTLLFLMTGLVEQFRTEPFLAAEQAGGGRNWVVANGTGGPFTSPKPIEASQFAAMAGGEPVLVASSALGAEQVRLVARAYDTMTQPVLTQGRYPTAPGEVVVDETAGLAVNEQTTLGGLPVSVVGLTRDTTVLAGVPLAFVTLEFGQQVVVDGQDLILARLVEGTPPIPDHLKLMTTQMIGADTLLPLDGAIASITLVRALLWLITIIIVAAVIYITALERTRDFAVLKAVGGRTSHLGLSLLVQGLIMTMIAVALAGLLQTFIAPSFPLAVRVPTSAWVTIGGGAAAAAMAAGMAGVLRIRSTEPAEAFG